MILYRFGKTEEGMKVKRLVFMAPEATTTGPDFALEDKNAKAEKIMKSPDSFNADADFKAAKAKIDAVAKTAGVSVDKEAYKKALAELNANRDAYKATQAFARDMIKYWPMLTKYEVGGAYPASGTAPEYSKLVQAQKGLNALNGSFGNALIDSSGGVFANFREKREAIASNIKNAAIIALDKVVNSSEADVKTITDAPKWGDKVAVAAGNLKKHQADLLNLIATGFDLYPGGKISDINKRVQDTVKSIEVAVVKSAELNLKAAQDNLKGLKDDGTDEARTKIEQAKSWEAGAKAVVKMQEARQKAVDSLLKAEDVGGTGDGLKKARQLFANAEKMGKSNVVEAAKLYAEAGKALEAVSDQVYEAGKKLAGDAFATIPAGELYGEGGLDGNKFYPNYKNSIKTDAAINKEYNEAVALQSTDPAKAGELFKKAAEKYGEIAKLVSAINAEAAMVKKAVGYDKANIALGMASEFNVNDVSDVLAKLYEASRALVGDKTVGSGNNFLTEAKGLKGYDRIQAVLKRGDDKAKLVVPVSPAS